MTRDWTFAPSVPAARTRLFRLAQKLTGVRPAPPSRALHRIEPRARWNVFFMFMPDSQLTPAQLFTLERLRAVPGGLAVICASPEVGDVPTVLLDKADAVYWKGLRGFDFSAYSIALREVATCSPGADLFIMNDSVLGPFSSMDALLERHGWDLTGFTAYWAPENHIQSYAFFLRNVTPERVAAFGPAIPANASYNNFWDVVYLQETRFARFAARRMDVGVLWYADVLRSALPLIEQGFPFLKRSLLNRHSRLVNEQKVREFLASQGHPLDQPY